MDNTNDQISLEGVRSLLEDGGYVSERAISMAAFLALKMGKPLLVEGPAGVGKTEIAKVMSKALGTNLIRLQCYEGLDATHALYEWNYQHQILHLKVHEGQEDRKSLENDLFSEKFLLKRPLLEAISQEKPPVLLIDEIDRADEEFESFLLEILSDWQITIPEIGTLEAVSKPYIILTGNRTRELSEALRRRCLYLWIDYPSFEKELAIVRTKIPEIDEQLSEHVCRFMQELRCLKLDKTPGVAETLDWAKSLVSMHIDALDKSIVEETFGVVLKDWQDIRHATDSLTELFEKTGITSKVG